MKRLLETCCLAVMLAAALGNGASAQWSTPAMISPDGLDAKALQISADSAGNFHTILGWDGMVYRKWVNGSGLAAPIWLDPGFSPNPSVAAAGNGDVHIGWEFWENNGPWVGWSRSTNGGSTFGPLQQLTSNKKDVKFPLLAHFGASNGGQMLFSWWNADDKGLYSMLFDGTNWGPITYIGSDGDNQYCVTGMCRSLQDGTVYRSYGRNIGGTISYCYRRFNGIGWEPEVVVASPGFFARQDIAVNSIGQIFCVWERNEKVYYRVYTPGSGWTSIGEVRPGGGESHFPAVAALPNGDFYVTYVHAQERCYGRRWSGSGWLSEETPQGTQANDFVPDTAIAAGPDGTLMAAWEYWGSGGPRWWYSIYPGTGGGPKGTLSGVVRDQYGNGISGATVNAATYATVSGVGGVYSMQVAPGTYTVQASKTFYTPQSIPNVVITANVTTTQDFTITANPPSPVTNFVASPSTNINRLTWTNPSSGNFQGTMIRYSTSGFPSSPTSGTLLVDKMAAPGSSDSHDHTGLTNGVTYYYSAFTHDDAAHYSSAVNASATPTALTCGMAKNYADNQIVDLNGKVVTAIFTGDTAVYISEPDRTSGIRVVSGGSGLVVGDVVNVTGQMQTIVYGGINSERRVGNATITKTSSTTPLQPLSMNNKAVGGKDIGSLVVGVNNGQTTNNHVNNQGILARVFGKVTYATSSYIYIDDGSSVPNQLGLDTPVTGVMIKGPSSTTAYPVGSFVTATGIIVGSVPGGWTKNRAYLQARSWSDVVLVSGPIVGTISGTVTDGTNPVSGATVSTNTGGYTATTAANGTYTISGITPGTYNVTASKTGYSSSTQNGVSVVGNQTTTVNFTLTATAGNISGVVKDNFNNAVSGATVSTDTGGYTTTTAGDGSYTLSNVTPGTYTVTASKSGYINGSQSGVVVSAGSTATVNLTLTSNTGTISGTVTDGANAVAGATVSTNTGGYTTTTNASGQYTLSGVTAGTYNVTASKTGYNSATQNNVSVTAGSTTTVNLVITAQPGSISGTVKDSGNAPISGATVSTNTGGYTTTTNASGQYTLSNVTPGTYNVTASKTNYNPQTQSGVVVSPGGAATANFTLTAQPGTISGTVKDSSDTPISGATVSTNTGGYSTTTNASGQYTLSNVAPGTYSVTASKALYTPQTANGVVVTSNNTTTQNFTLVYNPLTDKLLNGNFEGGKFQFWKSNNIDNYMANSWGACWNTSKGNPGANWDVVNATAYSLSGRTGYVVRMYNLSGSYEAGIIQVVSGLTPGAPYTFTAQAYQFDMGTNVRIAADPNGGTVLPPLPQTYFDNITGQWNSKSVTGTVGAGGSVTVFLWAYREWGAGADVFFDNATLMTY